MPDGCHFAVSPSFEREAGASLNQARGTPTIRDRHQTVHQPQALSSGAFRSWLAPGYGAAGGKAEAIEGQQK
jgi:hypothetical protein